MPYIKKELRPIFDFAVRLVQKGREYRFLATECIEFGVKDMPPEVMDGCLNYVFTQLFRKIDDIKLSDVIIRIVLQHLFWSKPKYFRFERVKGLLGCMTYEYQRRAWRRQCKVVKALKILLYLNDVNTSYYEEQKILENSDLD